MDFIFALIVSFPLLIFLAMFLLDSLFRAVFLCFAWRPLTIRPGMYPDRRKNASPIFSLLTMRNQSLPKSVAGLAVPAYVIADNCRDKTAEAARRAGARVWERREEAGGGKAGALRWFFRVAADELAPYSRFAIFDADSQVASDFCRPTGELSLRPSTGGAGLCAAYCQPVDHRSLAWRHIPKFSRSASMTWPGSALAGRCRCGERGWFLTHRCCPRFCLTFIRRLKMSK